MEKSHRQILGEAIQERLDGEKKYFGEYSYTHSQKIPIEQDFYLDFEKGE